jgi:dethiobiotin synthetase
VLSLPGVFVTGTDTGVGKTVVSAALALCARAAGRSVAYLKPAQTGWDGKIAGDAPFVAAAAGEPAIAAVVPYRLRAPLAPSVAGELERVRLDPEVVRAAYRELAGRHDLVIVEGAGGLLVPFSEGVDMAALAGLLGLPVLVVARPSLGTLSHTLLTLEAAHRRGLTVLGYLLSGMPAEPGLDALTNPGVLARLTPVPLLGVLPHDPELDTDAGRVGDLRRLGPEGLDPLLGGSFSPARFRRETERRLREATLTRAAAGP